MKQSVIYLPVQIDGADFRHFALFDAFTRRKMWRRPAVFTAILTVSAALCYSRYPQEGSVLLGTILIRTPWRTATTCAALRAKWRCSALATSSTPAG